MAAAPHIRYRRSRPVRLAFLIGAMVTVVIAGLFLARPASAATTASVSTAARTAGGQQAQPAGGPCSVPGIGDFGALLGLCQSGSSGVVGDLNNICQPSVPQPELATGGIDAMVAPPGSSAGGKTLYDHYGVAGQFWAAYGLQCSDMASLIGNNVAGMVFDAAKSLDRVTITVYQAAAGNGILTWLQNAVNKLITALGGAIYFPFLAPVVIIGAIWLAWQGLVRKRASRTIEGTLWMVVACAAAIWLIGQPSTFTGIGATVSNGVTQVLNTAFDKLPASGDGNCVPVSAGDPQSVAPDYSFSSGNGFIDENANELWSVLVCKPWLAGEFGTTVYNGAGGKQTVVDKYGRDLLWAQAIAANEQPTQALITAKQDTYVGIAKSLQASDPSVYAIFQGEQWTTRLEIGFAALFAALAAGLLVLLISLTLIILKLGWLLLLVAGPFFLIIGIHPGFGRVIAIRWFEMLVGVLLKQVAIALVLSILLYCYALIMGTSDAVLPWALKIMMIALVTVAAFIYRKPFTHLFSSVGYGLIGSGERAEYSYREATTTFRRATVTAGSVLPGVAAYRAARWARRNQSAAAGGPAVPAAGAAGMDAAGGSMAAAAAASAGVTAGAAGPGSAVPGRTPSGGGPSAGTAGVTAGGTAPRLRSSGAPSGGAAAGGGGRSGGSGPGGSGPGGSASGGSAPARPAPAGGSGRGGTGPAAGPVPAAAGARGPGSGGPGSGGSGSGSSGSDGSGSNGRPRQWPGTGTGPSGGSTRSAPPLPLGRDGGGSSGASWARNTAGWSGAGTAAGTGTGRTSTGSTRTPRIPPPPARDNGTANGRTRAGSGGRSGQSDGPEGGRPSPARFWQRRGK
jgi:hypothetical protein